MKSKKTLRNVLIIIASLLVFFVAAIGVNYIQGKATLSKNLLEQEGTEEKTAHRTMLYQGKQYTYKKNLVNILCMGVDKEEQMAVRNDADNSVGQADAIFLMSLDLEKDEVRVITIPRDTMVILEMYHASGYYLGSMRGQITLQYAYGDGMKRSAELMMQQVSALFNEIPINAYAAINVYSLWNLNEAVGGVDITMDEDYTLYNPAFEKGATVHLSGNLLENYIRGRDKTEAGSAYKRNHRLKQYMLAYFEKAKEALKEDVTLPFRCLEVLEENMETSITVEEIVFLVSEIMGCDFSEGNMYTLPGEQIWTGTYEEYHLDTDALNALIIELFYEVK